MYGLIEIQANINEPPKVQQSEATHISIGDLHGNTLKLIYILIEQGVLKLQGGDKDYFSLRDIYKKNLRALTLDDLSHFKKIIDKVEVNKDRAVMLIGDELCDRGQNDYFTLYLLNKLKKEHAKVEILFSNHGMEFIRDYERDKFTGEHNLMVCPQNQGKSLTNMFLLIDKKLITDDEVKELTKNGYMNMVKAIGYSVSEEGKLTLYTHAPVGLETIRALAEKLGLQKEYSEDSVEAIIVSIDKINKKIQQGGPKAQTFSAKSDDIGQCFPVSDPCYRLIWNRELGKELVTKTKNGLEINFVHGHIGAGNSVSKQHTNIDNDFGKIIGEVGRTNYDIQPHVIVRSKDKILTAAEIRIHRMLAKWECKQKELEQKNNKELNKTPKNQKYEKAAEAAARLSDFFKAEIQTFYKNCQTDKDSLKNFKENVLKRLDPSNPDVQVLKKHRGWKELILNMIGFLISVPKKLFTGTWFHVNTDSMNKIEDIKTDLNEIEDESHTEGAPLSPKLK